MDSSFSRIARTGAISIFLTIATASALAPLVAPFDPNRVDMLNRLLSSSIKNVLGTDSIGRDLLSRVIWGGRQSLVLTVLSTGATAVIATTIGTLAGYRRGWVDDTIMVLTGLFHGLPGIAVFIAIAGLIGPGVRALLIGLVIVSWPTFSRVVRTEVLRVNAMPFIESLRHAGASHTRIIILHILPNTAGAILVLTATRMATAILSVASLSFLGLGIQPPTPDWGVMIRDALPYVRTHPLMILAPSVCVLGVTYGLSALAESLRLKLDAHRSRDSVA